MRRLRLFVGVSILSTVLVLAGIVFVSLPRTRHPVTPTPDSVRSAVSGFRSTLAQAAPVPFLNGGFETDPTSESNGWTWPGSDWVWDGSVAHSGTHSARVYRGSGGETASVWSAYISVQPSTVYTLTYWLRTQAATWWPSVMLYQYRSDRAQTGIKLIAHASISGGTSAWNLVPYRFQTMPDADTIRVRIYVWSGASGTFWFDDFGLDQGARALYPFHTGFPVVASGSVINSAPVVADINNDGANELLVAGGSEVNGWDSTGAPLPGFPLDTGDKHIMGNLAVADLDRDGDMEIVAGTRTPIVNGQGRVFVWHHTGAILGGWPQSVAWDTQYSHNDSWVSSVVLADIDGDTALEILAGTTNNASDIPGSDLAVPNLYAWHTDGSLVAGHWPNGHTIAGIYGPIAAGDLNGDGVADVIVGRDHHFLNAYDATGSSLSGWPIETYLDRNSGHYQTDYHVSYGFGAPVVADLDGDGIMEYIVAGNVWSPGNAPVLTNSALLVLEPDGTRRHGWETPALGNGVLEPEDPPPQVPAIADLDNDGQLEIVVATADGWIRAYRPNKTVLWAFNYAQGANVYAGEPVLGDIDGDGTLEIIFGTYVPRQSDIQYNGPVGLWALKADGTVMPGFPLPVPTPGMRGAPTLADLDGDGDLEIVVAAQEAQVFVWDTPTRYDPTRLPWPTSRHDLRRSATYVSSLSLSRKSATPLVARQGENVTFTIEVASNPTVDSVVNVTDTIPTGLSYIPGTLTATQGIITATAAVLQWSGIVSSTKVMIRYATQVITSAARVISNTAIIATATDAPLARTAYIFANGYSAYLPLVLKGV